MRKITLLAQKIKRNLQFWVLGRLQKPGVFWIIFTTPLRIFYAFFLFIKNKKKKKSKTSHLTICIGNITLGGNGKTPFLMKLIQDLELFNPHVVSKGYKRKIKGDFQVLESMSADDVGDEPLMIKKDFPDLSVFVTDSRKNFLTSSKKKMIVFDDGLHEKKIPYDITVALFDQSLFSRPYYLMPTGIYREPISSIEGVDLIGIKGAVDDLQFEQIKQFFASHQIDLPVFTFYLKPTKFIPVNHGVFSPHEKIALFCGIGHPESFIETAQSFCGVIQEKWILADHEKITQQEFFLWAKFLEQAGFRQIVCTKKDAIKLQIMENFPLPVFFLETEFVIQKGMQHYKDLIEKISQKWLIKHS